MLTMALITTLAAGCSPEWKRKFLRKRKTIRQEQAILVLKSDFEALHPPADRYREHFAFWKHWHTDLLDNFGKIQKRDLANLNGAIGELRAMRDLLEEEPAAELRRHLMEMEKLQARWSAQSGPWHPTTSDRTRLERLQRIINRRFHYSNVQEGIAPDPAPREASVEEPLP